MTSCSGRRTEYTKMMERIEVYEELLTSFLHNEYDGDYDKLISEINKLEIEYPVNTEKFGKEIEKLNKTNTDSVSNYFAKTSNLAMLLIEASLMGENEESE